ncbi:MAG: efflux RND transporter periplasmic adaptor subunit [Vicinamibacterales bacterium]
MTIRYIVRAARPLILAVASVAASACSNQPPAAATASKEMPAQREVVVLSDAAFKNSGIVIEAVGSRTRTDHIMAPGLIALDEARTARIGSLQEGLILETPRDVGDRVRAGQLLATMHGHAMHDAWAGYRKALADRRRLEKELAYAVDAYERARRLFADKAISLQEMQRAEVERVSATETLDMANAEVNRSVEELEHVGVSVATAVEDNPNDPADESTEQIPVRSPIGGVVLERLVTQGTTVLPGTPLFVVSELSRLWAVAEIDESQLSQVRTGLPVEVLVGAYPDERFAGTVTFISDVVNPKTRRITVRSTVPNPAGRLKPAMFATVALGEGAPRTIVVVPKGAVQVLDQRSTVFVAEAGGTFRPRAVELGAEADGLIEVKSGIAAGERIAATGSFVLKSELLKPAAEGGN